MVSSWKVVATTVEYCGVGLEFGALVPHLDHDHHVHTSVLLPAVLVRENELARNLEYTCSINIPSISLCRAHLVMLTSNGVYHYP